MGENKRQKGVFYITRNSIVVCDEALSAPLVFPFDRNVVADFEMINKDDFAKQFVAFLQQNKVVPGVMSIVLGEDAFFEKEVPMMERTKKDEVIKLFIESVPFEHVATGSFTTKTGSILIATNKDFFNAIIEITAKLGFIVQYVIPAYYFDKKITTVDQLTARYILDKVPSLRQASLLGVVEEKHIEPAATEVMTIKKEKNKLPILIAIFLILILILAGVIYFSMQQTP